MLQNIYMPKNYTVWVQYEHSWCKKIFLSVCMCEKQFAFCLYLLRIIFPLLLDKIISLKTI